MLARIASTLALGLSLAVLAGCAGKQEAAARRQGEAVPVTAQVVQSRQWSDTLQALGTAKARESISVTAKVSEIVEKVHFESGQHIAAGAPIVTLRGQAQEAALVQAQATFHEADQLYKRQRELATQRLVSSATLDTQKSIRDAAEARVARMQLDIGDRRVRAPFAGVLGIRQVSPGTLLTPTTVIATLDDIEHMHIDFQVPEVELAALGVGDKVSATSVAWPGRTFEGVVSTIDARIDPRAVPPAIEPVATEQEAEIAEAGKDDLAGVADTTAPVSHRPWIELGLRPVSAGTTEEEAMVDFELTVGNAGDTAARNVRISSFMLADEAEGTEMERMLTERRSETIVPPVSIDPGDGTRVDAHLAVPKGDLGRVFNPVVVAEARYTLPDGSEARTAAAFRIGRPAYEGGIGGIGASRPHMTEDLAAELYGQPEHA